MSSKYRAIEGASKVAAGRKSTRVQSRWSEFYESTLDEIHREGSIRQSFIISVFIYVAFARPD
jgi:hypothetical protein